MKFRKVWFVPLALLCLGGAGVGTKMILARSYRADSHPGFSAGEGTKRASSKARPRSEESDAVRLAKVRRLLQETSFPTDRETFLTIESLIDHLSLEAVMELLDDPETLATVEGDKFPLRHLIRSRLWRRMGELDPKLALEKAFPDGKVTTDHRHVSVEGVLYGVAKVDRELAFRTWNTHFGDQPEDAFMTFSFSFFGDWSEASPEAAFAALGGIKAPLRQNAYSGYVRSLGEETDWQVESGKFEKLFPAPKDRSFRSQSAACALAAQWAISDPDAAFGWMKSLPDVERPVQFASFDLPGSERFDAYGQVVAAWMKAEPTEAVEWLKNWKAPGNSDRFYAQIIRYRGSEEVAISSTALELISDPAARDAVVREVLTQDFQKREVLRIWENSTQLSPKVRAEVTEAIRVRDEKGIGWTL